MRTEGTFRDRTMMDLKAQVARYIRLHDMAADGEPLWVAVSGGIDSMVLLHVLRALGHPCHVAHVDHGLRGAESDADRAFVKEHCARLGIPFREQCCDVAAEAAATGASTQMAARELRYVWFREMLREGPSRMALAHHGDDAMETFFMGLMQGMGLSGWNAIPHITVPPTEGTHEGRDQRGAFIRPLLGSARQEVEGYARRHGVAHREDASNASTVYLRNKVRHELLPQLEAMRPGVRRVMARNLALLDAFASFTQGQLDRIGQELCEQDEQGHQHIPLHKLLAYPGGTRFLLQVLLGDLGFHPDRLDDILLAIRQGNTGARFPGVGGEVLLDRNELVIMPTRAEVPTWTITTVDEVPQEAPLLLSLEEPAVLDTHFVHHVAWFDADALTFPLQLRPWQAGDRIRPIGLKGSKLVSDIITDAKVPGHRKSQMHVLLAGDRIVWVCGLRMAEGTQARPGSRALIRAEWVARVM